MTIVFSALAVERIQTAEKKHPWMPKVQFFFLGCVLGFIWEVTVYFVGHGAEENLFTVFANLRGFLHGPWVPIYGVGGLLFFGVAGALAVYFLEPAFQKIMQRIPPRCNQALCLALTVLFAADVILSIFTPNLGIGVFVLR